ncbi:MAG: chromate efflux transporter [Actinomycetota bacterium]
MSEVKRASVPLREALRFWAKLGFINFGGPAGQIALMHEELVDRRRWIGNDRFLHALSFCMLLPGPEAQQLAIYIGWLLNGTIGGIAAGVLFVLPAFFLILGLAWAYAVHGDVSWVGAIFYGLQAAVIGIVAAAVIRVGSKALRTPALYLIAAASFIAIFFLGVPFPLIVLVAGLVGLVGARLYPALFPAPIHGDGADEPFLLDDAEDSPSRGAPWRRSLRVLLVGLSVWWIPLLVVIAARGPEDTLSEMALFFSQAAMVTFGGAYAVLAYINEVAVQGFGWLEPGQMVTGLGLAESTPGPLIMVTEFVGFLGAYRFPGGIDPVAAGIAGAAVATWATFAPCFLWIFLGAPYIEKLRGNRALGAALSAITAAVVGVILNLAVTFAIFALFDRVGSVDAGPLSFPSPVWTTWDPAALTIAVVVFVGLWRARWNVLTVVLAAAGAGLVYRSLF